MVWGLGVELAGEEGVRKQGLRGKERVGPRRVQGVRGVGYGSCTGTK